MEVDVTREDIAEQLSALAPGKAAGISYEVYADLWPPGEPSEDARAACHAFAKAHGCRIKNETSDQSIWFIKDA